MRYEQEIEPDPAWSDVYARMQAIFQRIHAHGSRYTTSSIGSDLAGHLRAQNLLDTLRDADIVHAEEGPDASRSRVRK